MCTVAISPYLCPFLFFFFFSIAHSIVLLLFLPFFFFLFFSLPFSVGFYLAKRIQRSLNVSIGFSSKTNVCKSSTAKRNSHSITDYWVKCSARRSMDLQGLPLGQMKKLYGWRKSLYRLYLLYFENFSINTEQIFLLNRKKNSLIRWLTRQKANCHFCIIKNLSFYFLIFE